jgi:hypothetical protein
MPTQSLTCETRSLTEWISCPGIAFIRNVTGVIQKMSEHRFQIGQTVVVSSFGAPPGPYSITRLLPSDDGEPNYRGKSLVDDHERAISENAIRLIRNNSEPVPDRPLARAKRGTR